LCCPQNVRQYRPSDTLQKIFIDLVYDLRLFNNKRGFDVIYPKIPLTLTLSARGEGKSPLERGAGVCSPLLPAPLRRARPGTGGVGEGEHLILLQEPLIKYL